MLTPYIQHPLVFGLFVAELIALVLFVHQGLTNVILHRAGGPSIHARYAAWCAWQAAFTCCFLAFHLEVGTALRVAALHGMTIAGAIAMRYYMLSIAAYLESPSVWLPRLAAVQPVIAIWPAASLAWFALGGEPFFLMDHPEPPTSLVLSIICETVPRSAVYPIHAVATLALLLVDLVVLVKVAWDGRSRDGWMLVGVLVTCSAVAFELITLRIDFVYAVPVLFAVNLIEVLRITYVSSLRLGRHAARLARAVEDQREQIADQVQALRDVAQRSLLGELTSGIGHEMRNPLGTATLFIEAAQRRVDDGSEVAALLDRARRAVAQVSTLVTGIGRMSRQRAGDPVGPMPLRAAIDDAVLLCTARIRAAGAVVSVHGEAAPRVLARHTEIAQVIVNLLSNACDAVEGKAERAVRVEVSPPSEGQVRVRIVDPGTPPPPRIARAMFEAFFTTKSDGHALGLGLSISRQILAELGGELGFDPSAPTTTFVVSLPAAPERETEQVDDGPPRPAEPSDEDRRAEAVEAHSPTRG